MSQYAKTRIKHKHDIEANWSISNIMPLDGEIIIYDPDDTHATPRFKVGDGKTALNDLPFVSNEENNNFVKNLTDGSSEGSLKGISAAENDTNYTIGANAFAIGNETKASGKNSFASGQETVASGSYSHVEGYATEATAAAAHAEGYDTHATARYAHAEGASTTASGNNSHAEGNGTLASGHYSHAEGNGTKAKGMYSHAEGNNCEATEEGTYAHAEGSYTKATKTGAHAEGNYTEANGVFSHAEGNYTIAGSMHQHVQGRYNEIDNNDTYAHIVGNGTANGRLNIHTLDWNGNAWFKGQVKVGGTNSDDASIVCTQADIGDVIDTVDLKLVNKQNTSNDLTIVPGEAEWKSINLDGRTQHYYLELEGFIDETNESVDAVEGIIEISCNNLEKDEHTFYLYINVSCEKFVALRMLFEHETEEGELFEPSITWIEEPTIDYPNTKLLLAFKTIDGGKSWVANQCYSMEVTN